MAKKDSKLSPMMAQYFEVKSKYPDTILFFRVGDFYEMFLMMPKQLHPSLIWCLQAKTAGRRSAHLCAVFRFTVPIIILQSL